MAGDKMESGAGTSRGPGKRKRKNTENYSETEKNPKKIPAKKTSAKKIPTKKTFAKKQTKIPANKGDQNESDAGPSRGPRNSMDRLILDKLDTVVSEQRAFKETIHTKLDELSKNIHELRNDAMNTQNTKTSAKKVPAKKTPAEKTPAKSAPSGDKMEPGAGTSRGPEKNKIDNTENNLAKTSAIIVVTKAPAKESPAMKIPTKKTPANKQTKTTAQKDSSSDHSGSSSSSAGVVMYINASSDSEDSDKEIPGIISCDACHKEFNAYDDNKEDLPRFLHYDCKVCPPCIQEAIDDAGSTKPCTECGSTDIETCDDCDMQKKVCDECIHRMNENEDQESSEDSDHNNCSKYCYSEDELKQCPGLYCGEIFEADSIDDFPSYSNFYSLIITSKNE